MLCVERMRGGGFLPTISEYEPRCPSIVVELCSSSSSSSNINSNSSSSSSSNNCNQEAAGEDVPDCAYVRQPTVNKDLQCNTRGRSGGYIVQNSDKDCDKSVEKCNDLGSTKVRCLKQDAEQIINALQQRKPSYSSQSDIRNKTISPSWGTLSSSYRDNETKDKQSDIRNTRINTNSAALPIITNTLTQGINNNDIRNKTIRAVSHSDSNTARNQKPGLAIPHGMSGSSLAATEPWRAVVNLKIGDQVRIWAKDIKTLVVEAVAHDIFKLASDNDKEAENNNLIDGNQNQDATEHLVTIPDQISLDSLLATLSLEGQLIIKEIRQQKPSRGSVVVIPIEKL